VESLGYWLGTAWRPRWVFSRSIAREDLGFGIPVMAGLLLSVAYQGLDRIVLGRMAGAAVLGPYSFGQSLTTMPMQAGTMAVSGVLLPVYGRVQDASERIQLHCRSVSLVAGSGFLLLLLALVAGGDALLAIYGDKWERAASLLGVLGVAAVLRSLATLTADYLMGIGRADGFRAVRLVQLVVAGAAILPAYTMAGVVGVAWVMAAAAASGLVVGWLRIRTATRVGIGRLLRAYQGPAFSLLLVMPIAMLLLAGLSDPARPSSVLLAAGVTTLAYVLAWYALDPQLRDTVRGKGPQRTGREAGS
jgi:PST family polysaccharide transporter